MKIVQITPGAGGMYCGGCFRDNALVAELRRQGHTALMMPLYLPLTLDETDQSQDMPIFFSGINVYLQQKAPIFSHFPKLIRDLFTSRKLLKLAAGNTAKTKASDLGEITVSMLKGEQGKQAQELRDLISWLKTQDKYDVICLSNILLIGLASELGRELKLPVVCVLHGEDTYLDGLPNPYKQEAWKEIRTRISDVSLFIAPSEYYSKLMGDRLGIPEAKRKVIFNGINLEGYTKSPLPMNPPVLGFFARMCKEKGLDTLVRAFIETANKIPNLRLHVGGGCGPADEPFVEELKQELARAKLLDRVQFFPNVSREEKISFYSSLTIFSTPALYGESFGLYVIEAMASGVPVVQPNHAAFPEIIEETGGGIIYDPADPNGLVNAIVEMLSSRERLNAMSKKAREAVLEKFSIEKMARETVNVLATVVKS